jgi:hypothetical protein
VTGKRRELALAHPGDDVTVPGLMFVQFYDGPADGPVRRFFLYWHDPALPEQTKGTAQEGATTRGQVFHADWRWYARRQLEAGGRFVQWPSMEEVTLAQLDAEEEAERITVRVKGQHVRVGDDLWSGGVPHRVTRITAYRHPVVTRGEDWRCARSGSWGMTLSYDHGYAASYEITIRHGEPPYVNAPPDDDYLSPHYGEGAVLFERYAAEAAGESWREWLSRTLHQDRA